MLVIFKILILTFMEILVYVLIALGVFILMDFVAWFTHKYVMHGFLWSWHADHHAPERKRFEKNDRFSMIFALPSALLIFFGAMNHNGWMLSSGIGIALYGLAYFLYHDILFHKRLQIFGEARHWYFRGIIAAHTDHHKGKKNYGFLFFVPVKYLKKAFSESETKAVS